MSGVPDPILERRARIRRLVQIGQRIGYGTMAVAMVSFVVAATTGFAHWAVVTTIVALVVSIVVLPVPIVLGYGVRAAEREERTPPTGPHA